MRTSLLAAAAAATVIAGCVQIEDEPPDTDPVPAVHCSTCDNNGLTPDAWRIAPAELAPAALHAAGLRTGPAIRPLCELATVVTLGSGGTGCDLDARWTAWSASDPFRRELVKYMVKVGARHIDRVVDRSTGVALSGGFGLAPAVLTTSWDPFMQSRITAGMTVAVDYYANAVLICMKTETTPDCPPSFVYQELAGAGNLFAGRGEIAIGGYHAERPEDSRRVCPGFGLCNSYSATAGYWAATCAYAGPPGKRFPIHCADPAGGPRFDFPVQVFTEFDPAVFGATSTGNGRPML